MGITNVFPDNEITNYNIKVRCVKYTPDGKRLLSCGEDHTVRLWDAQSGTLLHVFSDHEGKVTECDISPNGDFAISSSYDNTVRVWDLEARRCVATLTDSTTWVFFIIFFLDRNLLTNR